MNFAHPLALLWALLAVPNIGFYRYQVSFKLIKH